MILALFLHVFQEVMKPEMMNNMAYMRGSGIIYGLGSYRDICKHHRYLSSFWELGLGLFFGTFGA